DGIRDDLVTGVQTCALPIYALLALAVGLVALAAAPRRANAGDFPHRSPPDLTGCWLGTYQNELNRDDCGTVGVEIAAQGLDCLEIGRASGRERGERWRGERA